jgi:hypothetical protein
MSIANLFSPNEITINAGNIRSNSIPGTKASVITTNNLIDGYYLEASNPASTAIGYYVTVGGSVITQFGYNRLTDTTYMFSNNLRDFVLGLNGTEKYRVKPSSAIIFGNNQYYPWSVTTTNADLTTVYSFTLDLSKSALINTNVIGRITSGPNTNSVFSRLRISTYKNVGLPNFIADLQFLSTNETGTAGAVLTYVTAGATTTVNVAVTGTTDTIVWSGMSTITII